MNDEPHFTKRIKLISSKIQQNKLFKTNDEIKIRRCDKSIHKAMRISAYIHQTNKKFSVKVQPKQSCKLESANHLWISFLDQPQSDIVGFAIITFQIYSIIVKKCKHVIGPNDMIAFNEE